MPPCGLLENSCPCGLPENSQSLAMSKATLATLTRTPAPMISAQATPAAVLQVGSPHRPRQSIYAGNRRDFGGLRGVCQIRRVSKQTPNCTRLRTSKPGDSPYVLHRRTRIHSGGRTREPMCGHEDDGSLGGGAGGRVGRGIPRRGRGRRRSALWERRDGWYFSLSGCRHIARSRAGTAAPPGACGCTAGPRHLCCV